MNKQDLKNLVEHIIDTLEKKVSDSICPLSCCEWKIFNEFERFKKEFMNRIESNTEKEIVDNQIVDRLINNDG